MKRLSARSTSTAVFFFFNETATPEISPLPLHDALPISLERGPRARDVGVGEPRLPRARRRRDRVRRLPGGLPAAVRARARSRAPARRGHDLRAGVRSEEHTSELQSRLQLVCRLLLENKKMAAERAARLLPIPCGSGEPGGAGPISASGGAPLVDDSVPTRSAAAYLQEAGASLQPLIA